MKRFKFFNGYVLRYQSNREGYGVYKNYYFEHILVAERNLGRPLRKGEVVHHLDCVKSNNNPKNILVLRSSEHRRLHEWLIRLKLNQHFPEVEYTTKIDVFGNSIPIAKIKRCKICKFPLGKKTRMVCSSKCNKEYEKRYGVCLQGKANRDKAKKREQKSGLTKEKLEKLLNKGYSWVELGTKFGYSDNGLRKVAKRLGVTGHFDGRKSERFSRKIARLSKP